MFKTELHIHTSPVSRCATVTEEELIEKYVSAGYSTVVLTNHLTDGYLPHYGTWDDMLKAYVEAFYKLKEKAEKKLNVIFGIEVTFNENMNDYLVYGVTPGYLRSYGDICPLGLSKFYYEAKANGFLIYQAHPFRRGMTIPDVRYLYGIEVFNGAKGHNSRNAIANSWADYHSLRKISGTDFHHYASPVTAGITTEKEIKTLEDLMETLISNDYKLIKKPWKRFLGNKPSISAKEID